MVELVYSLLIPLGCHVHFVVLHSAVSVLINDVGSENQ